MIEVRDNMTWPLWSSVWQTSFTLVWWAIITLNIQVFYGGNSLNMPLKVVANHWIFHQFASLRGQRKRIRKRKSFFSTTNRLHSNGTRTGGGASQVTASLTTPQIWKRLGN